MNLKMKRNIPTILLLVGILVFLIFGMGDQYVSTYSISLNNQTTVQAAMMETSDAATIDQLDVDSIDGLVSLITQ